MLMRFRSTVSRAACSALAAASLSAGASACPLCHTPTGREVRAGIFDTSFKFKLLATIAPFPVFIGVVSLIYFGPPKSKKH